MAYDDDPSIPPVTVRAAANRLGMSVWGLHRAIERGELEPVVRNPIKVSADDLEAFRLRRQDAAIARIGADRLVREAHAVRARLHPPATAPGPRGHEALEQLNDVVKSAFGTPLLMAAAFADGAGCRWCAAVMAGRMLGATVRRETLASEIGFALLGAPECADHRKLVRGRMQELAARVHPGGARPADARTGPVTAAGSTAPPASPVPRPRPAQPSPDDNGKSMIQRRLRETRARLAMARRSGDQRYAIKLRAMVQSLEQDAARVDGRSTVTASAKPGRLKCGHLLAANCGCPRSGSRRGQR